MRCKETRVPKDSCYIRFIPRNTVIKKKLIKDSGLEMYTARGELMIFDRDKDGNVIGIELLSSKTCRKKCQE